MLTTGTKGAIGECIVAADLMRRGFAIFRSISPSCSCDLVAMKEGRLLRVEVRTGEMGKAGRFPYGRFNAAKCDLMALITADSTVHYSPSLIL